jgi:hypothetical protein
LIVKRFFLSFSTGIWASGFWRSEYQCTIWDRAGCLELGDVVNGAIAAEK